MLHWAELCSDPVFAYIPTSSTTVIFLKRGKEWWCEASYAAPGAQVMWFRPLFITCKKGPAHVPCPIKESRYPTFCSGERSYLPADAGFRHPPRHVCGVGHSREREPGVAGNIETCLRYDQSSASLLRDGYKKTTYLQYAGLFSLVIPLSVNFR